MNYLTIDESKKKFYEYLEKIQQLEKEINSSSLTLKYTLSTPEEKDRTWQILEKEGENINGEIVRELYKLEKTYFSVESSGLEEGKKRLVDQYRNLLKALGKAKSAIAERREKKTIPIVPFHQEEPQAGYCYYCKVDISNRFSYQLEEGLKAVLKINIVEGARFCSRDCLSKCCERYEKWKETQQSERKTHQDKIIQKKELLTHLQKERTHLQKKNNLLKQREQAAEALYREEVLKGGEKKPGAWKKFLHNLGLAQSNSPRANWHRLRKMRQACELGIEKNQAQIQRVLLNLAIDEQVGQEWDKAEKDFLHPLEKKKEGEK